MAVDGFAFKKVHALSDSLVVGVALDNVARAGGKVDRQEAKAAIAVLQTNGNRAFVASHAPKARPRSCVSMLIKGS